ncbi:MAG: LysR substrate-binding domain-containing protein, partial [Deltaproteobacteria bacterium]
VSSPYRQRVIETFERLRTPLNIVMELPTVETIKKAVRGGMGVAFAPRMCLEEELASGELISVRVRELQIERQLRLIHRKHAALSAAARAFLEQARELARQPSSAN